MSVGVTGVSLRQSSGLCSGKGKLLDAVSTEGEHGNAGDSKRNLSYGTIRSTAFLSFFVA